MRLLPGWGLTMLLVLVAWVFFRAPNFTTAGVALRKMFLLESGIRWFPPLAFLGVGFVVLTHLMERTRLSLGNFRPA